MLNMGLWAKVKGVFGRIGKGIKDYVIKPVVSVASKAAAPIGAAIGSIVPGVGTALGTTIGTGVQALANGVNKFL